MGVLRLKKALLIVGQIDWWLPEEEKAYPHDLPCTGHLVTAVCCEMLQHADTIICKDHCITTWQLALSLSVMKESVSHITQDLRFLKLCMKWIPWSPTVTHKTKRRAIYSELLACFEAEGEDFFSGIVTADEAFVHYFELARKVNPWIGTMLNLSWRKNSCSLLQRSGRWSLSSGTVKVWFFLLHCWDGRQSNLTPTSGHW